MMWKGNADAAQIIRQDVFGKAGLLLVEIDRGQFEPHRRPRLELAQNIEQDEGILAAGQADHDPVALLDHIEILNGAAHVPPQALLELVELDLLFPDRRRHRHPPGTARAGG